MGFKYRHIDADENPFSSKNYPFSKEWSNYSAESLGRAFFSDGNVKSMGMPMIYDHIKIFTNSNFGFSNEQMYYKNYEIKLVIYTLDNYTDLKDKYYKVDLDFDQMCVFFCKHEDEIITKVKLGESLQKYSRFEHLDQTANFTITKSLKEIQNIELSTKKIIEFLSKEKPFFQTDLIKEYKDIELKEVYFLDEKEQIITLIHNDILDLPISNILYGEKIKIRVTGTQIKVHTPITIKLIAKSENENQKFEGIEKMVWKTKFNKNIAETPYFQIPLNWFNESIEKYNYRKNKENLLEEDPKAYKTTLIKELPEFSIEVSYGKTQKLINKKEHTLIPTSYRRNYEELIGLFALDNSGKKTSYKNYENDFISKNKEIEKIVTAFTKYIYEFPADIYKYKKGLETYFKPKEKKEFEIRELKKRIEKDATELWKKAVESFQEYRSTKNYDDRPLYWARLKMQSQLKRLPIFKDDIDFDTSQVKKDTKLHEIITLFEEKSRNYTGINFGYTTSKKILITGFDPFLLNSIDHPNKEYYNILQSNPSGCVALWLAGNDREMKYCKVQTMIVPVRYSDFDSSDNPENGMGEGIIEKYIKPWINKVDMIITVSQAGEEDYHIDVFATATRGGSDENMNFVRESGSKSVNEKSPETIVTTLPKELTENNSKAEYYGKYFESKKDEKDYYRIGDFSKQKDSDTSNFPKKKIYSGPGGNYLSNEIFYRVAKLRSEMKENLKTGHFHISKIQSVGEDFNNSDIKELINNVVKSLKLAGL
jgi:hypothetical protein